MPDELTRPDPDTLLAHVQAAEEQQKRGKLKVFLGYAAGVGKTYAMLEAARERRTGGVDLQTSPASAATPWTIHIDDLVTELASRSLDPKM